MPFENIQLNDGNKVPAIAFGTGSVNKGHDITLYIEQALETGFKHIDSAAAYRNEYSVGKALRESGTKRENVFLTSKYPFGNLRDRLQTTLNQMGVDYLDLYLIHTPMLHLNLGKVWAQFEDLKEEGLVKSIGVSNFQVSHLETVAKTSRVTPAVNQIDFDLYKYGQNKKILEYAAKHSIVIEGYNCLSPLKYPGGPADAPLARAADRLNATTTQTCLAWVKSKGVVIVTTSSRKERLQEYLQVGDLPELTKEEIAAIDEAAVQGLPLKMVLSEKMREAATFLLIMRNFLWRPVLSLGVTAGGAWLLFQAVQRFMK